MCVYVCDSARPVQFWLFHKRNYSDSGFQQWLPSCIKDPVLLFNTYPFRTAFQADCCSSILVFKHLVRPAAPWLLKVPMSIVLCNWIFNDLTDQFHIWLFNWLIVSIWFIVVVFPWHLTLQCCSIKRDAWYPMFWLTFRHPYKLIKCVYGDTMHPPTVQFVFHENTRLLYILASIRS